MNKLLVLSLSIFILACSAKEKSLLPNEANMYCKDLYAHGEIVDETYTFCAILPEEVKYTYKTGLWKFWNKQGQLIAKGEFKPKTKTIENRGGCPYEITFSTADKSKFSYWNEKGIKTEISESFLKALESCTPTLMDGENRRNADLIKRKK